jgi:hypothetical protein
MIAFIFDDCYRGRGKKMISYVEELMNYLPIDSFGYCANNKGEFIINREGYYYDRLRTKVKMFKEYKFVLAFEPYNETDYVTENLMVVFQVTSDCNKTDYTRPVQFLFIWEHQI